MLYLTRNQAGILEVVTDFITIHRQKSLFSTIKYLLFSPTFLSFFRRRFWGITIRSITQEVEGVALEINLAAMPHGFESHRLRQEQHPAGCCSFLVYFLPHIDTDHIAFFPIERGL